MRKRTLYTIAAIVAAAFTLACGAGSPDATPTSSTSTQPVVVAPQSADPTPAALVSSAPAPAPKSATAFDDGIWRVGVEIAPGTYQVIAASDCYWERLRGFGGSFGEIITNGNVDIGKQAIVTIAKTDKGFNSEDCGTWTKLK